jgi:hypothetical protein
MADLHKILNAFNDLGIENKGLTPDNPVSQGKALNDQYGDKSLDTNAHAKMIAESVQGKHIPGVTDVSSNDMAALAGVATAPQPVKQTVSYNNDTTDNSRWAEIDNRLSKIENSLNSIFESLQKITEMSDAEYMAKKKALQDIQNDPHTKFDPDLKRELKKRRYNLEKERSTTTKESLEKGFASFLKELEDK